MAILTLSGVGQSFGAVDLFSGISASLPRDGKVGLVGPNGVGKTTLLFILSGQSQPSSGQVSLARGTRLGYLPQESSDAFAGSDHTVFTEMLTVFASLRADEARLRRLEAAMAGNGADEALFAEYGRLQEQFELAGGYEYPLRIKQVLTGLGFDETDWELPLNYLSGGQKTRALLARLLLEKPDLLILDEPTNHLDVAAVEWLEGALKTWDGAVLVVSHDRYFLDRVVNTIWEMSRGGLETYRGNYSAYVQQRQSRWEQQMQAFADFKERAAKELDFIRRHIAGQRTQMAQGKLSRLAREVEAIRVGGLGVAAQLQSKGWAQLSAELDLRRPASTVSELQQALGELQPPHRPTSLNLSLRPAHRSGNIVLRTQELQVGYPGYPPLFAAEDIELHRLECAALLGGNGTGKTTFLRTILDALPPAAGRVQLGASIKVGYFSQTQEHLKPENSILDELLGYRNMPLSEARNYLARFLFRGDDVYKKVRALSGGEISRLALALLTLEEANFLLLDEPTNHLDIPAQEELQAALESFGGTVLLVSHDRYLVDRLATQIWEVRDGRLQVYAMPYQAYLAQRQEEIDAARAIAAAERAAAQEADPAEEPQLSKNELRRRQAALTQVEARIAAAEEKLAAVTHNMQAATAAQAFDKIQSLSIEYANLEQELETLLTEWETYHE
ncbi:MAG: ABC-F family ATP-binding cassette domain-containing protein [Anaerolineales bacterium]|nr:ABC-F family ATP-binding cassette domain-containing protein [Anaerolineales bacterium]